MNTQMIVEVVKKNLNSVGFTLKKNSPEILIVAGAIGTVTAAFMACRASMDLPEVLDDTHCKLDDLHAEMEEGNIITEKEFKRELSIVYFDTAKTIVKMYGPAIALGALSMGTVFASNNILRQRNASLAAAYATVDGAFKRYRSNVVEQYGEEIDKALRYGIKKQTIEEVEIDSKGKEKLVKKTVEVAGIDPNQYSEYARFFDSMSREWEKSPEYNLAFLKAQQQVADDMLKSRGYLFLNEVYRMLDIPISPAGQSVGWIYDEKNPIGDNFVDFGIYEINRAKNREFVNGYEPVILLDFNVDGNILSKI